MSRNASLTFSGSPNGRPPLPDAWRLRKSLTRCWPFGDLRHRPGEFLRVRVLRNLVGLALLIGHRPFLYHPIRVETVAVSGLAPVA